ncbi:MAG: tetratricopeptide repeat protein [Opitutaceae bacterium]|nr:tetratricopeptide repeat protein [Opitutaceae bacterium]
MIANPLPQTSPTAVASTPRPVTLADTLLLLRRAGQAALEAGNPSEAIDAYSRLTTLAPHDPAAHMSLAIALIKIGRKEEGIAALDTACRLSPKDARLWKLLGGARVANGQLDLASVAFENAFTINPADNDLIAQMVDVQARSGRPDNAAQWATLLLASTSHEMKLLEVLASLAAASGNQNLSRVAALRATALQTPKKPSLRLDLINVEITTFCNLKCSGCCRTVGVNNGKWSNNHMALEDFKRLVDQLPPVGVFVPYGIGEPTLHPEIFEIIRIAKTTPKFGQVMLTSNATARRIEDFDRLFELGLDRLCVSVDSLDPDLIDQVRPGTDVAKLKQRLIYLVQKYPGRLEIRSVVGKNNVHALPSLLAELNSFGKLDAYFQPYDDVGNPAGCLTSAEKRQVLAFFEANRSLYPNLNIVPQSFVPQGGICRMPWSAPFVTAKGEVTPCCRVVNPEIATFGNALETPFTKVWDSEETNAWRREFLVKSPEMCRGCPMFAERP